MSTPAQIAASRRNARKSTGPRSVEGKAVSRLNALKSGIDAQSAVIRGEDPAAEPKTLREFMDSSTKWYEVYPDADAKEPAQAVVALRWANNARGSEAGMTAAREEGP